MRAGRRNLASLLDDLDRDRHRPAVILRTPYRSFRWTRGQLRSAALALSERLGRAGVRPGDRVVLRGPDGPAWCAAFLGVIARGAVAVPLDAGASSEFSRKVIDRVSARAAILSVDVADALRDRVVPVIPLEEVSHRAGAHTGAAEPHRASPEETAEIVFTSGTTAEPRGVELSHANLLHALERIEAGFHKREWWLGPVLPLRLLCLVPLSHLFGQSMGLFLPILMRSTGVFVTSPRPAGVLRAIRAERPLALITTPRPLELLRQALEHDLEGRGRLRRFRRALERSEGRAAWRRIVATRDLRSVLGWRTWVVVVGGAPLEPETESFWSRCGLAVIQGYGMTEAAPIVTVHNPLSGRRQTLGRPVAGVEVRLAPDGEVLVRGPNVMKGYFDDPDATREALDDGWLHTGDLAERDETGRLHFRGRKKELIVTPSGMNVFPSDVERVLRSLDGVREAVVFGLRGPEGEEVHAAVLPDGPELSPERLRSRANEALHSHQRLRRVVLWEDSDFPRTATGKVRRGDVAAAVGPSSPGLGARGPAGSRLRGVLERVRSDLASGLDPGARLSEDLGLDSLEILELLGRLEEEYDVVLDDRSVAPSLTVGEVERIASGKSRPALRVRMPRWSRRAPVAWLRALLRVALVQTSFRLFVRLRVEGRGLPDPPCIFVANHTSVLDVPAVVVALPGRWRRRLCPAMAIETLPEHFEPAGLPLPKRLRSSVLYGLAVLIFGAYPMPQTRGFRPSLEYTGELLDAGLCPLVFPEGRMSRTREMAPFKSGIGLLALETRAPIVPVYLDGLDRVLPPGARWPRRGRARVILGEPLAPPRGAAGDAASLTRRIEAALRGLGGWRRGPAS